MTYRRSLISRAKLLYQHQQRAAPSFSHINRDDKDVENPPNPNYPMSSNPNNLHQRFYGTGNNFGTLQGSRNMFLGRNFAIPAGKGMIFSRNMSSASEKIEIMSDVLSDKSVEVLAQAAPVMSEVAVAASDSFFPVAALQFLVDYIHNFTGVEWWASIALTTLLIRTLQVPLMINQIKASSKFAIISPRLQEIKDEMQNKGMSPSAVAEGQAQMKAIMNEHRVTPFTPLKGLLITGPVFCSFFFAIRNMAENVPSFKEGGAFWFTDLTTPDTMYIFPVLTALTFWITVECNAQEGLEGNSSAKTIKNVSRGFAALTIPFTASFPKAIFCYWITSNLFSLAYGLVIKRPEVKKFLGIPKIPPPSANQKPSIPFFESLKKFAAAQQQMSLSPPVEASSKTTNERIVPPSVLNQKIVSLEKEVKGRRKGKKRR